MPTLDEILEKGNVKQADFNQLSDGQKKFVNEVLTQNTNKKPKELLDEYFDQATTVPDSVSKVPQEERYRIERGHEIMESLILGKPFEDKSGKLAAVLKNAHVSYKEFSSLDEVQQEFVRNELTGDIKDKSSEDLWNTYFRMRVKTEKPEAQMTEEEKQQKIANEKTVTWLVRDRLLSKRR